MSEPTPQEMKEWLWRFYQSWLLTCSRYEEENGRLMWGGIHILIENMDKGLRMDRRILGEIAEELRELSGYFNASEMGHPGYTVRWLEEKLRQLGLREEEKLKEGGGE